MFLRPQIKMSGSTFSIPARYFHFQHPDTTNWSVHRPRHGASVRVFVQMNEIVTPTPRMHDRDKYVVIFHPFFLRHLLFIPLQCALLCRVYFRVKPGVVCV